MHSQRRAEYWLQFVAAKLLAEDAWADRPDWRANVRRGLTASVRATPDWPALATSDASAREFLRNLEACGVGSGGLQ